MLTIILWLFSSVRSIRGEPVESWKAASYAISTPLSFLTIRGMLLIPQMHKTPGDASRSQRDDADRAAVVAVENDWLSHQSDGPRLSRILVDDFMHPIPSGLFLNKQDHIQWAVEHPRPAGWRARFDKLKVRVYVLKAIANGIVEASDSPEVKLRKTIFTDVFVYRDNRWQAVNAQENEIGNGR